tara:strand:- start:122 stop:382 length:261 start_codon:yes stop_codon:yes gene_type:complete
MADLEPVVASNGKVLLLILVDLETLHLYLLLKEAMDLHQLLKVFPTKVVAAEAEAEELTQITLETHLEAQALLVELELHLLLLDHL